MRRGNEWLVKSGGGRKHTGFGVEADGLRSDVLCNSRFRLAPGAMIQWRRFAERRRQAKTPHKALPQTNRAQVDGSGTMAKPPKVASVLPPGTGSDPQVNWIPATSVKSFRPPEPPSGGTKPLSLVSDKIEILDETPVVDQLNLAIV